MWKSPCMTWNVFHICLPHISVYKMDNLLLFLYFVFPDYSIVYTSYGSRTSTRQGRGNTMGFTPGQTNRVTQRVTKQGGTTRKWEMSRLYLVIWVICCFMGYVGSLWLLSTITFQTFTGSFSRHRSLKETSIWLTDVQVFRKCSNWNLPKNSKQHLYYGNADFGTNYSKEKCSCM